MLIQQNLYDLNRDLSNLITRAQNKLEKDIEEIHKFLYRDMSRILMESSSRGFDKSITRMKKPFLYDFLDYFNWYTERGKEYRDDKFCSNKEALRENHFHMFNDIKLYLAREPNRISRAIDESEDLFYGSYNCYGDFRRYPFKINDDTRSCSILRNRIRNVQCVKMDVTAISGTDNSYLITLNDNEINTIKQLRELL